MTIVMPIIVVALLQNASIKIIMVAQIGIVIMAVVIVVEMKSRYRSFITQMPMQAFRCRPGNLERNE